MQTSHPKAGQPPCFQRRGGRRSGAAFPRRARLRTPSTRSRNWEMLRVTAR